MPQTVLFEPRLFSALIRNHGVTILFQTTALFNERAAVQPEIFGGLRYAIFGGEAADPGAVRRVLKWGRPEKLLNVYGPTETTTLATWYRVDEVAEQTRTVPIGGPISNTKVFILDDRMQPVPMGVKGELYIGGAGVALGYLNRPELTAERFIADPFFSRGAERLFRSGDVCRWRADGNIEYLGRNDQQVKIRGYRIELGEVEAQLAASDEVRDAVVLIREDTPGERRLVAYITPLGEASPDLDRLRQELKGKLPEYMIPAAFVVLDKLPVNANGKVNRHALPTPQLERRGGLKLESPEGDTEVMLAEIWRELLHLGQVGRHDSFFELGGHSLHGIKLMSRVGERFGVPLPVVAVFQYPTIREMALAVEQLQSRKRESQDQGSDAYEQGVL